MPSTTTTKFWLLLLSAALLVLAVYWPGIHGGFLFDDLGTLPKLGKFGPVDNWVTFWRYITSDVSDPTGRPVAMLSFLLDAGNWPASPLPFKRTNLILHALNGIMLMLFLRRLGHTALCQAPSSSINLAAVLAGSYWLLQPLLVSTTLYIVQRETMLCACFILLGLHSWLHGRNLLLKGVYSYGLPWMIFGLGACTVLALLSKANGVLLPILVLIVEYTFLRAYVPVPPQTGSIYRHFMLILAFLPALGVTIYLVYQGWTGFAHGVPSFRPWTLGQRLLTEPRVLMDYLHQLWLPRPFTDGLFNDQVQASTSLFRPITTLFSLLMVAALIFAGWYSRSRWPAMALAILFYFSGQMLESSTVPLELYFEHRNYTPALMMYWPLCLWLCNVPLKVVNGLHEHPALERQTATRRPAKMILAVIILLGLASMTHSAAKLWGDMREQAIFWAALNPNSSRAQAYAAIQEMNTGHPDHAAIRLQIALTRAPREAQLALNLFTAECALGRVPPATLEATRTALHTMRDNGPLLLNWFDNELAQYQHPPCPELNLETLHQLLEAALSNSQLTSINGRRQDLYHLQGRLALAQGNADLALQYFDQALDQQVTPQTALDQAALLGAAGFPKQGLAHLDYYQDKGHVTAKVDFGMPSVHVWLLQREQYWPQELARLRTTLSSDDSHHLQAPR